MHKLVVIGLLEPKKHARHMEEFGRKIGFEGAFHGDPINSHIWIFWRNGRYLRDFTVTAQSISFHVNRASEGDIKLTTVYAKCNRAERLTLWEDLRLVNDTDEPWIVGGDFNIILNSDEKRGGNNIDIMGIQEFLECILTTGISEIPYEGNRFTWCNNQKSRHRIWE